MSLQLSPILNHPGAVPAPEGHPDEGVPWHFGDPFAEQRAAARTVAVVDRSHRDVLTVAGPERLDWLHKIISQHVTELPDASGTEALILDAHGHVEAHMLLAHVDGTVWLDAEPGAQITSALPKGPKQTLLEYMEAMKFWSDVTINDVTSDNAVLTLLGPKTGDVLDALGIALGTEPQAAVAAQGVVARRTPWPGKGSVDLIVPRSNLPGWWQRIVDAGARPAGSWAYEALRVESVRPRLGVDTDERAIPHELGWIEVAAHVAKGCYRGQETVSKVFNVGRPPRNLLLLHLDGSPELTPETGDEVLVGERPGGGRGGSGGRKTVGRVGTVVQHHELGPIALALVKRSVKPDTELLVGAEDRRVQATIDPDSVPTEHPAPGRAAVARLRG